MKTEKNLVKKKIKNTNQANASEHSLHRFALRRTHGASKTGFLQLLQKISN